MDDDHPTCQQVLLRLCLLLLALALLPAVFAGALTVSLPSEVDEGDAIGAAVSGPGALAILIDDVQVASGTGTIAHSLSTDHTGAGLREYRFTTTDPGTPNETRLVTVRDVPLALTVTAPAQADTADPTPTFALTENWAPELCYVVIDGSDTRSLNPTSPTSHSADLAIADGVHTIAYRCKLGFEIPTVTRTIHVDTTAPVVIGSAPSGVQAGSYVTIHVDTDEIALCRYGPADAPYSSLPLAMGATYATRNSVTIALEQSGPQTYFVRCADVLGNAMGISHVISFTAKRPPSATLEIDGEEPLRAGTYKVTLRADQPLASGPSLTATFSSGAIQQIGLTPAGGDRTWEGYLLIEQGRLDASVSFSFRATAADGTVGTEITGGSLAAIDAVPPGPIASIAVANTTNGILLTWFSLEGEDNGITYRIYRADHEGVDYTHEISTSADTTFNDPAGGARYYWYRVAAVDAAGNLGPLSAEVYGSSVDPALAQSPLDAVVLARLDETLLDLTSAMTSANSTIVALETEQNPFRIQIIKDMDLVGQAIAARVALEDAFAALQTVRDSATTSDEALSAIEDARSTISESRSKLIRRIVPDQQTETRQVADARELERQLPYAIAARGAVQDRDAHLDAAVALQDHVTVTLSASTFSLWGWDNIEHHYTFVRKRIALETPATDVWLIEIVPKTLAEDVDELLFSTPPTVLERDPVVGWSYPVLQEEEFTYVVDRKVPLEEVKASRTLAYPAPVSAPVAAESDGLTGFSVFESGLPGADALLLGLGALVIVALGAYYVTLGGAPALPRGLPQDRLAPIVGGRRVRAPIVRPSIAQAGTAPLRIIAPRPRAIASPRPHVRPADQPRRKLDAAELLALAEEAVDARRTDEAAARYREALEALARGSQEGTARDAAQRVYRKLQLCHYLDEAAAALERGDASGARAALVRVRAAAESVGEQPTTLIKEATRAYREFMGRLNRLEIDHASRY